MATISSITEVRRVIEIGFDYEPGTTGSPVTTSVTYEGQEIQVTVQLPSDCPEPDLCDCEDLVVNETIPNTKDRIVWVDTGFTGECNGGSGVVNISGVSGDTIINSTVTVDYASNNSSDSVTRTTRLVISGSPVTIRVTIPPCEHSVCGCGDLYLFEPHDDIDPTPTPPIPGQKNRWVLVSGEYECDLTTHTKYNKEKKQVSTDGGSTWSDTGETRRGSVIEYNSQDCGYTPPVPGEMRKTVSGTPYCDGNDLVVDTHEEVSYDNGTTWQPNGVTGRTVVSYGACGQPTPHTTGNFLKIISESKNCDVLFGTSNTSFTRTIYASTDNGITWNRYTSSNNRHASNRVGTVIASLTKDQYVLIKGDNETYSSGTAYTSFHSSGLIRVEGNIMSLINSTSFDSMTTLTADYQFAGLFHKTDTITSAENLTLPNTTSKGCYSRMFLDCIRLTKPPVLPAKILSEKCYEDMFYGAYILEKAPELPSDELKTRCYAGMFYGCERINNIKCLASRNVSSQCLDDWVIGVSKTGTFIKKSGITWERGDDGIPNEWTIINT